MTKKIIDNPAKRLLAILQECKNVQPGSNCRQAWQHILKTEEEALLFRRMAEVLALADQVVSAVQDIFPRHLRAIETLRIQLNAGIRQQNLNGNWAEFVSQVSDDTINSLDFASSLLEEREELIEMQAGTLEDQKAALLAIRKEIADTKEIPEAVRLTITRYIQRLVDCIDEYFITGVFPVLDAVNTAIGNIAFDAEYRKALESAEAGKKFATTLGHIANAVTVATGIAQLAGPAVDLIKLLGAR